MPKNYRKSSEENRRYNQRMAELYGRFAFLCERDKEEFVKKRFKELGFSGLSEYFRALIWADMQGKVEFCGTGKGEER